MCTNSFAHRRRSLLCVVMCVLLAAACDSRPAPTSPSPSSIPAPAPSASSPAPTPTPAPPPPHTATPVPFNLTQNRTLDILGWDSWGSAPTPSVVQFRWNAAIGTYEVLAPGYTDWSRLEALQNPRSGGASSQYDVF